MKITSQISRFSSYLNGETPYVKDGNWWVGDKDTGVAARAVDGVSFSGIDEYYFATLSTDIDDLGKPIAPVWVKENWVNQISASKFGTKDANGVTYKYLWNVEVVKSTDASGVLSESSSEVELFLTQTDSRVPVEYISYYAASNTSAIPSGYPQLGENNNFITSPSNDAWVKGDKYNGSTDESAFLFEISFVKYENKDENGHNLYAYTSGSKPIMIGHNGSNGVDAVSYKLTVIPNSWNTSIYPTLSPVFVVTQHEGTSVTTLAGGYVIKVGDTVWQNNSAISDKTTFDLYVNGTLVDSQSVTPVSNGADGYTPQKGVDYFDGSNGQDGTSIIWKGAFDTAPANPENGWAYYNTQAKASYTYRDGNWYQMSIDGINGQNGTDGKPIVWKGVLKEPPSGAEENWVYKDEDDGKIYIYHDAGWELMVLDGNDGDPGAPGTNGLSVFIAYNKQPMLPQKPSDTNNGTAEGWTTIASEDVIWMSQKVAEAADKGSWGEPIRIKGASGEVGSNFVASVIRDAFAESQWSLYGAIGHEESWTDTASIRNGCRVGDIFTVVGTATDTGRGHVLYYRSTNGGQTQDLQGICFAHSIANAGARGPKGDRGDDGTGVAVKADETSCTTIGDSYIDANGDLLVLTQTSPKQYTNAGKIKGPAGESSYFHTAYANSEDGTKDFSTSEYINKIYIGHYADTTEADSQNPSDYKWSKMQGDKGDPGKVVSFFRTRYTGVSLDVLQQWASLNLAPNEPDDYFYMLETPRDSLGNPLKKGDQFYAVLSGADGNEYAILVVLCQDCSFSINEAYTRVTQGYITVGHTGPRGGQGIQGPPGPSGETYYTWIKYADSPTSGMSDNPAGKAYMGIAYNKTTKTESTDYGDYTWSLTKGEQGVEGPPGPNGETFYTWIKYADDASGANMSDKPTGKSYIGIAYNKTTKTESTEASDYTWSRYKGEDGSSIKKIDTYVRDFPYYATSGDSWTGVKSGATTAFIDPGHSETWTANSPYDNSHIRVGDTAYLIGTVSDKFASKGVKQSITLYGLVTAVTGDGVTMTTTNAIWGGTQGDEGPQGPQGEKGENAQDFNISASSYMLSADSAGNIKTGSKVTLTAHAMNLDTSKIQWSSDNSIWTSTGSSTYEVTATGTYYAKVKDTSFKDSVTIGKTIDGTNGTNGVDAISMNLTNPTMTFSNNTSGEAETCRVIVYEGATKLSTGTGNSKFSVAKSSSQANVNGVTISGDTITVADQTSNGSYTVTVTVKNSEGTSISQDYTIYWNVVTNGEDGVDGDSVSTVYAYYKHPYNSISSTPSGTPATSGTEWGIWYLTDFDPDSTYPYIHRSEGKKTVSGNTTSYGSWQKPELYKAYNTVDVPYINYAEYLKITNFNESGLHYDEGKLYINADHIKVLHSDKTSVVFEASSNSNTVSLAGWTVDNNSIRIKNLGTTGSMWLCRGGSTTKATIGNSGEISGWSLAIGQSFGVTAGGTLYASQLQASGGKIANWTINNNYGIHANYKVGMVNPSTQAAGLYRTSPIDDSLQAMVFYAHTDDPDGEEDYPNFCVLADGSLFAKYASISGEINGFSGTIGGWALTETCLYSSYNSVYSGLVRPYASTGKTIFAGATGADGTNAKFYVQNDGTLYATSGILATGCVLGPNLKIADWGSASSFTALHSGSALNASTLSDEPSSDATGLLIIAAEETSCGIALRGKQQVISMNNNAISLQSTGTYKERMTISASNPMITCADNGNCGRVGGYYSSSKQTFACQYSIASSGQLELGLMNFTNQAIVISGTSSSYTVATKGTWSGSISGSSDYRLKKNICNLNDKYEDFFDLLSPASFEFYKPSDGRDVGHVGFIAQEVQDAIKWSGLEERDWGGLVTYPEQDRTYYALTYTEFVALNTWQIQKLKPRMTAAEQEIEKLKLEIQQLRTELQNLQNS